MCGRCTRWCIDERRVSRTRSRIRTLEPLSIVYRLASSILASRSRAGYTPHRRPRVAGRATSHTSLPLPSAFILHPSTDSPQPITSTTSASNTHFLFCATPRPSPCNLPTNLHPIAPPSCARPSRLTPSLAFEYEPHKTRTNVSGWRAIRACPRRNVHRTTYLPIDCPCTLQSSTPYIPIPCITSQHNIEPYAYLVTSPCPPPTAYPCAYRIAHCPCAQRSLLIAH